MKSKYLIATLVACNIAFAGASICLVLTTPKIYSVGVNRLAQSFTNQLEAANLDVDAKSAHIAKFSNALEAELKSLVKGRDVLLMEESVISGAIDITDKLAKILKDKLNENTK